jgi:hypothetical protein
MIDPGNISAVLNYAKLLEVNLEFDEAKELYKSALIIVPDNLLANQELTGKHGFKLSYIAI